MKNVIALFALLLLPPTALSAPTAETTPSPSSSLSLSPSTLPAATPAPQPNSTPTPTSASTPTQANTHLHFRAQDEDEPKGQPPRTSQFWLDFTKSYDPLTQAPRPTDIAQPQGGGQEAVEFEQTTYYTCKTRDATITHCGWHIPITWVGEAGGDGIRGGGGAWGVGARAVVVGIVAVVVAVVV